MATILGFVIYASLAVFTFGVVPYCLAHNSQWLDVKRRNENRF